jgi:hypothetical protein
VTTTFESSNELLDQFFLNVIRSHYDIHVTIPTDCPQRNERLAFLGDQQIYSETAVYMTDMTQFYSAFAQVARDYQLNAASRNYAGSLTGRGSYYSKTGVPYDTLATQKQRGMAYGRAPQLHGMYSPITATCRSYGNTGIPCYVRSAVY